MNLTKRIFIAILAAIVSFALACDHSSKDIEKSQKPEKEEMQVDPASTDQPRNVATVKTSSKDIEKSQKPEKEEMQVDPVSTDQPRNVATVKTDDGAIYELSSPEFLTNNYSGGSYYEYGSYNPKGLIIFVPPDLTDYYLRVYLPVDALHEVIFDSINKPVIVKLTNGTTLEGLVETKRAGERELISFMGSTQVEGFPASIEIRRWDIKTVMFTRENNGVLYAEVEKKDGSIRKDLKEAKFIYDSGDSRHPRFNDEEIGCKIGDSVIRIPSADIVSFQRVDKGSTTLTLKNGKKINADDCYFEISGKTSFEGMEATFQSNGDIIRELIMK
jgi:hypothetical protein